MEITSNNLLNILLPNDNKALKEVLKQADIQQLTSGSKATNVQEILKNLFNDITTNNKSTDTVLNLLKNSNVFKELGSFPKELKALVALTKNTPTLAPFQAKLENFMLNINNLDDANLKSQLNNSGVFLESKISQTMGNLPNAILNTLTQLKDAIQSLSTIKNFNGGETLNLIDKLLSNANSSNPTQTVADVKNLLTHLKQIVAQLNTPATATNHIAQLVNKLETLFNKELTTQNPNAQITAQAIKPELAHELKTLFTQLQTYLAQTNTPANKEMSTLLDKLLSVPNLQNNPNLLNESKHILSQLKQLPQIQAAVAYHTQSSEISILTTKLETIIKNIPQQAVQTTPNTPPNTPNNPQIITNTQQALQNSSPVASMSPQVTPTAPQATQNAQIVPNTLQNNAPVLGNNSSAIESLTPNTSPNRTTPITNNEVLNQVKTLLTELQTGLSNFTATNTATLTQLIETTLQPQNFSQMNLLITHLQTLLNQIHTTAPFSNALQNSEQNRELLTLINKFETIVTKEVLNNPVFTQPHNNVVLIQEDISKDMKAILLQVQQELTASPATQNIQEMLKHIDKLLVQIDYNQLMSLTSNSNFVYVPFMWDLLEEGTIKTTKGEQEKFYCEINLKLKEHGNINLLLAIYNKNSIDLTLFAQRDAFKQKVQENLQELKKSLNSVGLIPMNIKLLDLKEETQTPIEKMHENSFNATYGELNLGLDIRV